MSAPVATRPVTILIAALGGEGGGVLTDWIVNAAAELGFPVQSTSIPGVAQRTGATTYYIEIVPMTWRELGDRRPVLALTPGVGDIDIVLATELLEAGRVVAGGFATADKTLMIASTSRFYVMNEKIAMGDGRYDQERLLSAIKANTQNAFLFDLDAAARDSGAMVNAVMLGALAGCGRLPLPVEAFQAAIRRDGKAVEANLAGFRAGLAAVLAESKARLAQSVKRRRRGSVALDVLEGVIAGMPPTARDVMTEGVRRLAAYQDLDYAKFYLERLQAVREADARCGAAGRLLRETARHLAVRMSYEDVIRVAQAKIDPERMARIRRELKLEGDEPFALYEFLKPGVEESCQVLPPWLARRILAIAERRGWLTRFHLGMEVQSTAIGGYLRFWVLARLRRWRRGTYRYVEEQAAIDSWLELVIQSAQVSPVLALEVAECARLIKGYGDTHRRGSLNFRTIEERIVRPALAGTLAPHQASDAVASARTAALVDPEGESLGRCLAQIEEQAPFRIAAE
jgi:indolepyruvate ferredoxin oxidoreductase beta subunit